MFLAYNILVIYRIENSELQCSFTHIRVFGLLLRGLLLSLLQQLVNVRVVKVSVLRGEHLVRAVTDHVQHLVLDNIKPSSVVELPFGRHDQDPRLFKFQIHF